VKRSIKSVRVTAWMLGSAGAVVLAAGAITRGLAPGVAPIAASVMADPVDTRIPISSLPFTITGPGSYYLTASLTLAAPDQNGIEVDANDVTIDLMGHSLIGAGGVSGISIAGKSNVEIRNGTVSYWEGDGIHEKGGGGHRILGVRVAWNGGSGIYLAGVAHLVKDCTAAQNGGYGMGVADGSTLDRNTVIGNYLGIYTGSGCTVTNNTAQGNWAAGMLVESGCTVTGNTLDNNQWPDFLPPPTDIDSGTGLIVNGLGNAIRGNTLRSNSDTNIRVKGTHNAIENNLVTGSKFGIYFEETGNFYANNRASQNTTNYMKAPSSNSPGDGGGNATF
jgi:parallel beta-helix repeat protein